MLISSQSNLNMHLTVAAVIEHQGKFLLVTDNTSFGHRFNQPAGHIEDGESILHAITREVKEEAGLDFQPQKVIGLYLYKLDNLHTYLRICFKGSISGNINNPMPNPDDDGVVAAAWYTLAQIKQLTPQFRSELVGKCIDDYLLGQEFDLSIIAPYKDCSNK